MSGTGAATAPMVLLSDVRAFDADERDLITGQVTP
jgi:hypothetical protein